LAAILWGALSPVWMGFVFMAVFFPQKDKLFPFGEKSFEFPPDFIMFWGSVGIWGLNFFFFLLSFIPTAATRFMYFLATIISAGAGPFSGYWFCWVWYIYIYA
jgi:hypothetical protein